MSADKRSTHTDALATLGTIIGPGEKRDAIHLAVEPVIANESLIPGVEVGWVDKEKRLVGRGHRCDNVIGIVDPFLKNKVQKGERFWLIVPPRKITSLRHVWTHPDFPAVEEISEEEVNNSLVEASKQWIESYAGRFHISYDKIMDHADSTVACMKHGAKWYDVDYIVGDAELEGESVSSEFWRHYEIVRGEAIAEDYKQNFFSCSCS